MVNKYDSTIAEKYPGLNPFDNIITQEQYEKLCDLSLLDFVRTRNISMTKRFHKMRQDGKPLSICIESIMDSSPYITFETVQRIVYTTKIPEGLKP